MTGERQEQFWFSIFVWCSSYISQPTKKELTVKNCTVVVRVFPLYYEKNHRKKCKKLSNKIWLSKVDAKRYHSLFMCYDSNT